MHWWPAPMAIAERRAVQAFPRPGKVNSNLARRATPSAAFPTRHRPRLEPASGRRFRARRDDLSPDKVAAAFDDARHGGTLNVAVPRRRRRRHPASNLDIAKDRNRLAIVEASDAWHGLVVEGVGRPSRATGDRFSPGSHAARPVCGTCLAFHRAPNAFRPSESVIAGLHRASDPKVLARWRRDRARGTHPPPKYAEMIDLTSPTMRDRCRSSKSSFTIALTSEPRM